MNSRLGAGSCMASAHNVPRQAMQRTTFKSDAFHPNGVYITFRKSLCDISFSLFIFVNAEARHDYFEPNLQEINVSPVQILVRVGYVVKHLSYLKSMVLKYLTYCVSLFRISLAVV